MSRGDARRSALSLTACGCEMQGWRMPLRAAGKGTVARFFIGTSVSSTTRLLHSKDTSHRIARLSTKRRPDRTAGVARVLKWPQDRGTPQLEAGEQRSAAAAIV